MVEQGHAALSPTLTGHISFQTHDFKTAEPVSADVYILRSILHDHLDARAIKILHNLLPAMKKGSHVILNEELLLEPLTLGRSEETIAR